MVAKAFHQRVILKYGAPREVISDRGTEFLNQTFTALAESCGVHHLASTAYHPESNAATERGHRFFGSILKIARNSYGQSWDDSIHYACMVLNTMPIAGTTISPFELLFGYKPLSPADAMIRIGQTQKKHNLPYDQYVRQIQDRMETMYNIVRSARVQQIRRNRHNNSKLRYEITYKIGDLVLVYRPTVKKGVTRKLLYKGVGPYEVISNPHPNVYKLRRMGTSQISTHNVRDICPYISRAHFMKRVEDKQDVPDQDTQLPETLDPKPGDYLLFPGTISDAERKSELRDEDLPFYLCKVVSYDVDTGSVHIQYYNTYSKAKRPRVQGYYPCWKHESTAVEQFAAKCPKKHLAVEDPDIPLEEFCPVKITPMRGKRGSVNLKKEQVRRALKLRPRTDL